MLCGKCNSKNKKDNLTCKKCGANLYRSKIRVIKENGANTTHYLFSQSNYKIGRATDNDIIIADESISRCHAEICYEDGFFAINDCKSKNGSLLNNLSLSHSVLRHQDCIQLGNVVLHYYDDEPQFSNTRKLDTIDLVQREYFRLKDKNVTEVNTADVLQTMLDLVVSLVGANKAAILQVIKPAKLLYKMGSGFKEGQVEINKLVTREYGLFRSTLQRREMQVKFNEMIKTPEETGTGPFYWQHLTIPLLSTLHSSDNMEDVENSEVLGICYLACNKKQGVFSRRKKELLSSLVQQMALAIENEYLHKLTVANNRLKRELSIALHIQKRLLPIAKPNPEHFSVVTFIEPCETIGGDYFDLIQISNSKLAFAMGDICGKGVPAALLASTAQAAIRSQIEERATPSEIVSHLNQMLVESTVSSVFLTLFFGILDLKEDALTYVNAGHPPPILIKESGEIRELAGTTPPLGILEADFQTSRLVKFEKCDALIMYTDGVIESQNAKREIYGRSHFLDLISTIFNDPDAQRYNLDYLVGKIKTDLLSFTKGTPQADDLTLLAAKRKK